MKHSFTLLSALVMLFTGSLSFANDVITVVDESQNPVANATVLFGYESNNPFPGNTLTTDAGGIATVPGAWKAALPVTAQAPGYVATTIPIATPGSMTIQLSHQELAPIQVAGQTTGFGTLVDNGKVQFGMVIPAFERSQLISFDIASVISPQTDQISVLSQTVNLPSNVTLPTQTVTYVLPVKFDKPNFRSYVRYNGSTLMTAMHGNFILSKVVTEIRAGKSIFDMINDLVFTEGGTLTVPVNGDVSNQALPVNQIQFTGSSTVQAPQMAANQLMVSVGLNETNGMLLPTDLKRFTSGQSNAVHTAGGAPSLMNLLMVNANPSLTANDRAMATVTPVNFGNMAASVGTHTNPQGFTQLSYNFLPANGGGTAPQFIPLFDPPTFDAANNVVKMNAPAVPAGMTPVATYLVMTEVLPMTGGTVQSEQRTRLWEVWSPAWLSQVELPKISFTRNPNRIYRWEVFYLAQPTSVTGGTTRVNGVDLGTVTHVTRNAVTF